MSAFKVNPPKKPVNPEALAAFTAGAEMHQPLAEPYVPASQRTGGMEKQTESILFRLTKRQLEELNFVYENTNVKSKQKLLESIILPEIEQRAREIRKEK